jgi:hypothetical protein
MQLKRKCHVVHNYSKGDVWVYYQHYSVVVQQSL